LELFKNLLKKLIAAELILLPFAAPCEEAVVAVSVEKKEIHKQQIPYLMQCNEIKRSIDLYQDYRKELGRHDFEILQQMATILLEQGARSDDPEKQLLSLYGSNIGGISSSIDILEAGVQSRHPQTQIAAIQLIGQLQDDRSDELLTKAMSSEFFYTRMEAAYFLAVRKNRNAVGQIESLMYRIPPQMRFFFPEFFALIGTPEAISVLRHLMDDQFHMTRIESILSAARFGRDDLLPIIRSRATHLNVAEQEACAAAFGQLRDSKSLFLLKKMGDSSSDNIRLAAYRAMLSLGDAQAKEKIFEMARNENIHAIALLGDVPGGEEILLHLIRNANIQVRFNAAYALLKRRDPRCTPYLLEFILRDSRDLGFQPTFTVGNSLMAWKVIPSVLQHAKDNPFDILAMSLKVREQMLRECLELPEREFLEVARRIFDTKQADLIPLLVALLQNHRTPSALELLISKAQTAGAPLIRTYCDLALLRIKQEGPYLEKVRQWISAKKNTEMIRFRPTLPWNMRISESTSSFELTPEENSRLLIECYQSLADRHEDNSIDIILEGIKEGHAKNRSVLAGLLIRALQ